MVDGASLRHRIKSIRMTSLHNLARFWQKTGSYPITASDGCAARTRRTVWVVMNIGCGGTRILF